MKREGRSQRNAKMKDSLAPERAKHVDKVSPMVLGGFLVYDLCITEKKKKIIIFV